MRSSWAVVDYPAKLGGRSADADGGVDTSEAWAAVTAPSACRAVEAVRTALVGTNRHLVSVMVGADSPATAPAPRGVVPNMHRYMCIRGCFGWWRWCWVVVKGYCTTQNSNPGALLFSDFP